MLCKGWVAGVLGGQQAAQAGAHVKGEALEITTDSWIWHVKRTGAGQKEFRGRI
jgi:hypothetical protein